MAVKVVVLEGEDLTVGIRSGNLLADGTRATNNAGWFKVDDFRIELARDVNKEHLLDDLDSLISVAELIRDTTRVGLFQRTIPSGIQRPF